MSVPETKTMKYTFVDARFGTITCNSPTTPTTPCGRAAEAQSSAGSTPAIVSSPKEHHIFKMFHHETAGGG